MEDDIAESEVEVSAELAQFCQYSLSYISIKIKTMEETQPLRFARLLQMVRSMEADMG